MKSWVKTSSLILLAALLASRPAHAQFAPLVADEPATPDSIVQITAEAQGLERMAPENLPRCGTFWTVLPSGLSAPMPCPPNDPSFPIFAIAPNGQFLVDMTGGQVTPRPRLGAARSANLAIATASETTITDALEQQAQAVVNLIDFIVGSQVRQLARTMGMEIPGFDETGTNSVLPTNSYVLPDYGTNLWIAQVAVTNGWLTGIGTNTAADMPYEIQSRTNLLQTDWQSEGFIYGLADTNWTPLSVAQGVRTNLFIRLFSWASSDGSGLPDWWQELYGVTDPYGDPDGDGWNNLQEFQNGTDPNSFDTPVSPTVKGQFNINTKMATIHWQPSQGLATNYLVQIHSWQTDITTYRNISPETTEFQDDLTHDASQGTPWFYVSYSVQAQYVHGNSGWGGCDIGYDWPYYEPVLTTSPQGRIALIIKDAPSDLSSVKVWWTRNGDNHLPALWDYRQFELMSDLWIEPDSGGFDIPASKITNGICELDDSNISPYFIYEIWVQTVRSNGAASDWVCAGSGAYSTPFVDARRQLKDNLQFKLRAGYESPYGFGVSSQDTYYDFYNGRPYWYNYSDIKWSQTYVASGFFCTIDESPSFDGLRPVYENVFLKNLVFDPTRIDSNGFLTTGCHDNPIPFPYNDWPHLFVTNYPDFYFDPTDFLINTNAVVPVSHLDISQTKWILCYWGLNADEWWPYTFPSNARNYYGLPLVSVLGAYVTNGNLLLETFYPGSTRPGGVAGGQYQETAQPIFQTAAYYFANPQSGSLPERQGFAVTNGSKLFIQSVGTSQQIAGYAKLSILNGYTNVFAYLGQYFSQAYRVDATGSVTSKPTGILSPYGHFFAMEPGVALLETMEDLDTQERGFCPVRVIGLNVDKNHDGEMDCSFTGPDSTSWISPFRFWVNDNHDYGDDGGSGIPLQPVLRDASRSAPWNQVQGTRDLVDFFPVYVNIGALFQTNAFGPALNPCDTNYRFVLRQDDSALYYLETDLTPTNYLDFLRDTNIAASLAEAYAQPVPCNGTLLSTNFLAKIAAGKGILLMEAGKSTSSPLVLEVWQGSKLVAESCIPLEIGTVETMFRHKNLLPGHSSATPNGPVDRLTKDSVPNEPDTSDKNFVFLHGYNVNTSDARGVAADMYKRMYWSGSQAKFYAVTWKGADSKIGSVFTPNYHTNVVNAFNTASQLADFISSLTNSGPVIAAAHSLGNMLTLSAINDWNAPISQYFMIDAAVPIEAIDPASVNVSFMTFSTWTDYSNRLFTANWYLLFPTNDARSTLSWNGRLSNLRSVDVYNFYSSGEEVLRSTAGDPPLSTINILATQLINRFSLLGLWPKVPFGTYSWYWQEKGKGTCDEDGLIGSSHGGWQFSDYYYGVPVVSANSTAYTPNSKLPEHPFFDFSRAALVGPPHPDLALTNAATGSAYAATNRNRILADAIPAMSLVAGANPVPRLAPPGQPNKNFDMMTLKNGWSLERAGDEAGKWHHSDFVQMAYTFTYQLFNQFVTTGNLK